MGGEQDHIMLGMRFIELCQEYKVWRSMSATSLNLDTGRHALGMCFNSPVARQPHQLSNLERKKSKYMRLKTEALL
jgi:hypothetical protein